MITIKAITPKTYQGKVTGYSVELSDGVIGYLDDKNSSGGLKVGDNVSYTLTVKKNKQGNDYNLLAINIATMGVQPPQPQAQPQQAFVSKPPSLISPPPTSSLTELKAQASLRAMEFVVNAYIADKIQWDQIKPNYVELRGYLWDGVDEGNS